MFCNAMDDESLMTVMKEVTALSLLKHPNIVQFIDFLVCKYAFTLYPCEVNRTDAMF